MTAENITAIALSHLSQLPEDSQDTLPLIPNWLNVLLAECLPYENELRRRCNKTPLANAPTVTAQNMGQEIDFDQKICTVCLPYGLASKFYEDDDNDFRSQDYRARFVNALAETTAYTTQEIVDVYAEGETDA